MQSAGLTVNSRKVQLAARRIELLGFVFNQGSARLNEEMLNAILQYQKQENVKNSAALPGYGRILQALRSELCGLGAAPISAAQKGLQVVIIGFKGAVVSATVNSHRLHL